MIAEALAAGKTIVATDCHSVPAEILENGEYVYLVAVHDAEKMSQAIIQALNNQFDPGVLKKRANDFEIGKVVKKYLDEIFNN